MSGSDQLPRAAGDAWWNHVSGPFRQLQALVMRLPINFLPAMLGLFDYVREFLHRLTKGPKCVPSAPQKNPRGARHRPVVTVDEDHCGGADQYSKQRCVLQRSGADLHPNDASCSSSGNTAAQQDMSEHRLRPSREGPLQPKAVARHPTDI